MFRSARLKLTASYLAIIILISAAFSVTIYLGIAMNLGDRFQQMERRIMHDQMMGRPGRPDQPPIFRSDLEATKRGVAMVLVIANGLILIVSAGAGWVLAGKTLKPIEESMEEQKRFVADASHELRTPLTALRTEIEVALQDQELTKKEARAVLASNMEEVEKLQTLASDLLSLAQYQRAESGLGQENIDISTMMNSALKKISAAAKAKDISIEIKADSITVQANEQALEQLVVILLDNAIKYTPAGGQVTASAKLERQHAILEVADTGVGIAPKDVPHIFDRFYRTDDSRSKDTTPGFGLGLSIAKKIVALHKGRIGVESEPGRGTVFTVSLPA